MTKTKKTNDKIPDEHIKKAFDALRDVLEKYDFRISGDGNGSSAVLEFKAADYRKDRSFNTPGKLFAWTDHVYEIPRERKYRKFKFSKRPCI